MSTTGSVHSPLGVFKNGAIATASVSLQNLTQAPVVWVNAVDSGDVGRANYTNNNYIEVETPAPYSSGFTATCSFQIPFSASSANEQSITVELVQLAQPDRDWETTSI